MFTSPRRGRVPLALASCLLVTGAGALALFPTTAQAASTTIASGPNWSVTSATGGYEITLDLPDALPVRDATPDLVVNGTDLGPATESADGKTLTLTTMSSLAATATRVSWQWSTGGTDTGAGTTTPLPKANRLTRVERAAVVGSAAADDPLTIGTSAYQVSDYDFGAQSMALSGIGGIRGEMAGRIYLPSTPGEHPLVIFMHGRHSACYNATTLKGVSEWPCDASKGDYSILSYAGYDSAGEALAADGYTVVSISVNAINANDNQLSPDDGAASRGQAVLDTLTMLQKANAGDSFTEHDAATGTDNNLDQALANGASTGSGGNNASQGAIPQTLHASDLVGTIDFDSIGVMGHSRGGEGAVTAASLNEGLAKPWNIKSVFALAPIDFTRDTLPDVATVTLLPYCDGDVSDQQGQHFYADSRHAFDDNVLRSDVWVMGTDHDFYNTAWTPPYPGASDDWSKPNDSVCGTSSPTTTRLSTTQQDTAGAAYVAGWFELTLGGSTQFQGMFDGTGTEPSSISSFADVRTVAQEPASMRDDIVDFASTSPLIGTSGTANAKVCASNYGRTVPEVLPSCTTNASDQLSGAALTTQQQPYWTPASFAPNVPLNPMTDLTWTSGGAALAVSVPSAKRDVSSYDELSLTMSPDQGVSSGTDMTLSVTDTSGDVWSAPVSSLNKWAVNRMPGSDTSTTDNRPTYLHKLVLQQVHVPTSTLASAGLDLTKIAQVKLTAGVGLDATAAGGVYLSDLTFDSKGVGTPKVETWPTVNVASTKVEEGSGPGTADVAVYLSQPATKPVTTYLSMIGSATGKVGLAMQKVTFEPGETCQAVTVPTAGDTAAGTTASTSYKMGVSNSSNAVLGANDFGTVSVREDDGVSSSSNPALGPDPAVGAQGDVCKEHAAQTNPGALSITGSPAPGSTITTTGTGYRDGESVDFTLAGTDLGSAIADADGTVTATLTIPADAPSALVTLTGTGAGSGYAPTASIDMRPSVALPATAVTLTLGASSYPYGTPVTGTVAVSGATGGTVHVTAGSESTTVTLGSDGAGSFTLPAGLAVGSDTVTASFAGTDSLAPGSATAVAIITKKPAAMTLRLGAGSFAYGTPVTGTVAVSGATGGTVHVTAGSESTTVTLGSGGTGSFTLPAGLSVGSDTVTASFAGTDSLAPRSATVVATVTKAPTTISASLSRSSVAVGKTVVVSAKVAGYLGGAKPTGTVKVVVKVAGKSKPFSGQLTANDTVRISVKAPKKGMATLAITYGGNAHYTASKKITKKLKVS